MEKRKFPRVDCTFQVSCQTFQENRSNFNSSRSRNISIGGILLSTNKQGRLGEDIIIKFMVPQYGHKVLARGRIVRIRELKDGDFEIGVQFLNIRDKDIDQVSRFIQEKIRT